MKTTKKNTRVGLCAVALLAAIAGNAFAVDLVTEDFETDGEGSRYTSNTFDVTVMLGRDFFIRSVGTPAEFGGTVLSGTNPSAGAFWASEDVKGPNGPGVAGIVRLADLDVSGMSNLQVHVYFATGREGEARSENDDFIRVERALDGLSGGTDLTMGTYTTVGQFVGDNPTNLVGGLMRRDTNLNGQSFDAADAGSPVLTETFVEYTFPVGATGSTLSVQVVVDQLGGSEEFAFDHIRITGDAATTVAPVLAGIEGTSISYTEEDPATQITNSITVADADSANIESATIQISAGNDPTEDVLALVGAPAGITVGAYVPATGTLPLSGTATKADYQAALRLVTYVNNDLDDPSLQTRTVRFLVNDETDPSNAQTRAIDITPDILTGTVPHRESFETDGEGERYLTNGFNAGGSNGIFEPVVFSSPPSQFADTLIGFDGSWWFAAEGTSNALNPLAPDTQGYIKLHDLDASGFSSLMVSVDLAVSNDNDIRWEPSDKVLVQYAFDGDIGTSEDTGTYTTVGAFYGDGADEFNGGDLRQDADLDGLADPTGIEPTTTFQTFTFAIPDVGSTLSVRLVIDSDGSEELGIDSIEVTGTEAPPCPPPVEASLTVQRILRRERVIRGTTLVRAGALAYLDVGVSDTDFAASAATVTLGDDVIDIPAGGLAVTGPGTWSYASNDRTYRVRLSRFGATSRYRLRVDVSDSDLANGEATVSFENADILAAATVSVAGDRFLRGRGASSGPPLAIEYFRSRGLRSGTYSVRYRGRIPFDGSGPGAAPELLVCAGAFSQLIDAADVRVTTRGFRYFERDVARGFETGVLRVTVDTVSGLVIVDARVTDLGTSGGPSVPVTIGFGQDGDDHAVQVLATLVAPDTLRY